MNQDQFEARMRAGEIWHDARVPINHWAVVRVDGRGFSGLTERHFNKPFDARFYDAMAQTARALMEEWDGLHAFFESDEISVLLPRDFAQFGRGWEKLVSLSAACAAVHFGRASGLVALFDARVWVGESVEQIADYFRWRQSDAARCALNGWCYWTLRAQNSGKRAATRRLEGLSRDDKIALLAEHDVDWDALPSWQRRGAAWSWETYQTTGIDPQRGEVTAVRRRLKLEESLPLGADYGALILGMCG